jgi:topoisomerase IA-like protein
MDTSALLSSLDSEIATLKQARALLADQHGRGPRAAKPAKKKGTMSAAGRARIAAAQRRRWAKLKAKKKAA